MDKRRYTPLCTTLAFLFGGILGMVSCNVVGITPSVILTIIATLTFHFTHFSPSYVLKKFRQ
jgi:chromate transport protein ChrA